jgi:hypothetical protein
MVDGNCNSCVYFTDFKVMGTCKRFPQYANRHATEWCGEYKAKPPLKEEVVEVFDIPADITAKKRGRPAKVLHD